MLGGPPYAVAMTFPPPVCMQHADPSQAACLSLVLAATLRGCPVSGGFHVTLQLQPAVQAVRYWHARKYLVTVTCVEPRLLKL